MRYIILTLYRDYMALFGFLKDNPTAVYNKDDHYRFIYIEPLDCYLTSFKMGRLWVEVADNLDDKLIGWTMAKNYPITYAGTKLLTELRDLEQHQLKEQRQGTGLAFTGWLLDIVSYGITDQQETARLIRAMFVTGYDMEQVIQVFSSLTRRKDLSRYFIQELSRLYKGVTV